MIKLRALLLLLSIFYCTQVSAQSNDHGRQMDVIRVVNTFFDAVKSRDTVSIKKLVLYPHQTNQFLHQSGFNENGEVWASQSTLGGFLQDLGREENIMVSCSNKKDVSIELFDRYAIVSAKFKCYDTESNLDNCGKYTIRLIKSNEWKIEQVYRYIMKDNCAQADI